MAKVLIAALVVALVLSGLFVVVAFSQADGQAIGVFPNRTFEVIRSPPGGPRSDTVKVLITPDVAGYWSVRLESLAGAAA